MKTPIKPEDIRKGDLIRFEYTPPIGILVAEEYIAPKNEYGSGYSASYYLLERPEPPFEPYWGMVIGHPTKFGVRAVYLPNQKGDQTPWLVSGDESSWQTDGWAKQKLAEGWVIIEKPEGVK